MRLAAVLENLARIQIFDLIMITKGDDVEHLNSLSSRNIISRRSQNTDSGSLFPDYILLIRKTRAITTRYRPIWSGSFAKPVSTLLYTEKVHSRVTSRLGLSWGLDKELSYFSLLFDVAVLWRIVQIIRNMMVSLFIGYLKSFNFGSSEFCIPFLGAMNVFSQNLSGVRK